MRLKFGPTRDVVLLLAGLGLLGHETLIVAEPRIALLTLAAGMIGLPATFFADRRFVLPSQASEPTEGSGSPEPDRSPSSS